jgi:hypothetical protein
MEAWSTCSSTPAQLVAKLIQPSKKVKLLNSAQCNALELTVNATADSPAMLMNEGFWGINAVQGRSYRLSFFARGSYKGTVRALLCSKDGKTRYAETVVNGFPVDKLSPETKVLLMGGGIGAPPLLGLMKTLRETHPADEITAVLGYRGKAAGLFLTEEFEKYGKLVISSDDGSVGTHGTVIDAIRENDLKADIIYSCGPMPMLKGVAAICKENGAFCEISLEERMACGIGACLGCACRTKRNDEEYFAHVCKDGPVFNAEEVLW